MGKWMPSKHWLKIGVDRQALHAAGQLDAVKTTVELAAELQTLLAAG